MADGGEGSQELTVESGVAGLGVWQLPGKEPQGGPRLLDTLLEYSTYVCVWGIHCKGDRSTRDGMHKDGHSGENVSSTRKAASRGGVQSNSLPGPLRVVVRGARIKAAFLINFLVVYWEPESCKNWEACWTNRSWTTYFFIIFAKNIN